VEKKWNQLPLINMPRINNCLLTKVIILLLSWCIFEVALLIGNINLFAFFSFIMSQPQLGLTTKVTWHYKGNRSKIMFWDSSTPQPRFLKMNHYTPNWILTLRVGSPKMSKNPKPCCKVWGSNFAQIGFYLDRWKNKQWRDQIISN
jgi:hypothetical protein